jgi:hypothetical protein
VLFRSQIGSELYGSALGDIESQIAALESQTTFAAGALGGFAGAIQEVAEAASDSLDLLLGDLSPLKDRQKLELALQGLRAGTVSQEQVLQIGRRLMASGSDYNALFDEVMRIGDRRQTGGGSVGGGGAAPIASAPTISAELQALYAQRDALVADQAQAARRGQAFDLAQIVADIAGATGDSIAEVLSTLTGGRATLEQFASDLGIGIDDLQGFIDSLQAATYSPFEIAEQLRVEFDYLLDGLRGILDALFTAGQEGSFGGGQFGNDVGPFGQPILPDEPAIPDEPIPVVIQPGPPQPERPIEREQIDRIRSLEDTMAALIEVVAMNTGRTADGVEALASSVEGDTLGKMAGQPRSVRGVPA